jgi:endonuclease III
MKATSKPARLKESPQARTQRVRKIVKILQRTYAGARLALDFKTPLDLLIALILAAQFRDVRVNEITPALFKKYRKPEDWARADRARLEDEIRKVTFYRNKTKAIQACCRELVERFGSRVPERLEDLLTLPGVGRKTANILRGNAFGQPAIGVDRHVARVSQRLELTEETDPDTIEFDLNPVVPDEHKVKFCYLLQAHGRTICLARKPDCPACPIKHLCPYPAKMKIPLSRAKA